MEDTETKEIMNEKQANSVSVNFQATDTLFFGID